MATSCARLPETPRMRQIFICTIMSIRIETKIAKANAALSLSVKTAVCVRNPGPIAEVAIKNAAPIRTLAAEPGSFFFSAIIEHLHRLVSYNA